MHEKIICLIWLCACAAASAQDKTTVTPVETSAPTTELNLDVSKIAAELNPPVQTRQSSETLSLELNKLDQLFQKAAKHGDAPEMVEINTAGSAQRVTRVNHGESSYCVYAPTVSRTDGIDAIQKGLQNQVRSCPQESGN